MTLGLAEAARRAGRGIVVSLAMDIDADALGVYRENLGHLSRRSSRLAQPVMCTDVLDTFGASLLYGRLTDAERCIRRRVGAVDILVGGPPCQGHSDLNNRTRRNDERNELYTTMARAARTLEPSLLIIENVPSVLRDRLGVVQRTQAALVRLGYSVADQVLSLDQLGVPQTRRRHVLVATKNLDLATAVLAAVADRRERRARSVRWAIEDLEASAVAAGSGFHASSVPSATNRERMRWLVENDAVVLPNELRPDCHRLRPHSYKSVYGRMRWDQPAQTVTSGFLSMGQGCYVHPGTTPRTITPHEAARLQTFPDFFRFDSVAKRTAWARMIGNAVPPFVTLGIAQTWLKMTGRARRPSVQRAD